MSNPVVGQEYCVANWFSGHETSDVFLATMQLYDESFQRACDRDGVNLGPPSWAVLRPGDEYCPDVPAWVEKQINVLGRRQIKFAVEGSEPMIAESPALLVCYRKVTEVTKQIKTHGFILDLTQKDLQKLRKITKAGHLKANPGHAPLTDSEADTFIEDLGPDVAYDLVSDKTVH